MEQAKNNTFSWILRFATQCKGKMTVSVLLAVLGSVCGIIPYFAVSQIVIQLCSQNYDLIPIKQEVKATVSGIYITRVRSLRGPALVAPPKQKFRQRLKNKVLQKMSKNDTNSKNTANTKKKK